MLDVLDYSNGQALFSSFVEKYFVNEEFRFHDEIEQVICLARIFVKHGVGPAGGVAQVGDPHPAILSELLGIMLKYLTLQLSLLDSQQSS